MGIIGWDLIYVITSSSSPPSARVAIGGGYTNDEKPGSGARERAILLTMIWPPFRLMTALPSGSESV